MGLVKTLTECGNIEREIFQSLYREKKKTFSAYSTSYKEEDFVLVLTPKPYMIELENYTPDLDEHIIYLQAILKIMGISLAKAGSLGYTLNIDTGEKLRDIAWKTKNKPALVLIENFNW